MMYLPTLVSSVLLSVILFLYISSPAFAQPSIGEPSLTAGLVLNGLTSPTSIAFLDENNVLLLEKEGSVRLISNGQLQPEPVLQLAGVESNNERGLLGIEVMDNKVFLYVTESGAQVEGIPTEGDRQPIRRQSVQEDRRHGRSSVDPDGNQTCGHRRLDPAEAAGGWHGRADDRASEVDDGDGRNRLRGPEGPCRADQGGHEGQVQQERPDEQLRKLARMLEYREHLWDDGLDPGH